MRQCIAMMVPSVFELVLIYILYHVLSMYIIINIYLSDVWILFTLLIL